MKVYVVSKICDDEYFCRDIEFITLDEQAAIEYCKKHNVHFKGWDDQYHDSVTYKEYDV